ncbi:hypothetical protein DYBT9275_01277 [Dyadobacter sp. CECT 9275]|uniref:FecR family protein n=1 Tax=Dyadobacter helix TaxID=2822344 RepID=A0A916JBR5_9BACT|nr:FecR family protein [Dyadobacter sp. CECT 9275]CAG4993975.1 hypothetical protein DYBT9275_01277 [Dyadobacter sp. CECT 9275]
MNNYKSYTLEDFLHDESFRNWVQGVGNQEVFWITFLNKFPEKQEVFRQAEHIIRAADVPADRISEREIRNEVQLFIERAGQIDPTVSGIPVASGRPRIFTQKIFVRWAISVAAMLLVSVGLNWYLNKTKTEASGLTALRTGPADLVQTSNDTGKPLKMTLADGSEVVLSPKSYLRYPSQFADSSRIVYLVGEASFSVKRQGQSFLVYTGEVITKVLGTRFVVRAFDQDKKITVQVQTGKVSVYVAKPKLVHSEKEVKGLIITANQAAIFEKDISQLSKTLVKNPEKLTKSSVENISRYDEVPLPVILHDLEKAYGITVQFDARNFMDCRITATLSNESMYEKLDILCRTISASYEIVDGQIIVSGKGCQ